MACHSPPTIRPNCRKTWEKRKGMATAWLAHLPCLVWQGTRRAPARAPPPSTLAAAPSHSRSAPSRADPSESSEPQVVLQVLMCHSCRTTTDCRVTSLFTCDPGSICAWCYNRRQGSTVPLPQFRHSGCNWLVRVEAHARPGLCTCQDASVTASLRSPAKARNFRQLVMRLV